MHPHPLLLHLLSFPLALLTKPSIDCDDVVRHGFSLAKNTYLNFSVASYISKSWANAANARWHYRSSATSHFTASWALICSRTWPHACLLSCHTLAFEEEIFPTIEGTTLSAPWPKESAPRYLSWPPLLCRWAAKQTPTNHTIEVRSIACSRVWQRYDSGPTVVPVAKSIARSRSSRRGSSNCWVLVSNTNLSPPLWKAKDLG
jgi:hypothetical protein